MDEILRHIKPQVRAMTPYTLVPHAYQVKLNQNENPLGFPEALKEELFARVGREDWARYPDFNLTELREALARHVGVPAKRILVGNGSNELIYNTLAVTLGPGDEIVIPVPTFSVYKLIATVMGATVHEPLMRAEEGFALPVDQILDRARRAKVIVLCSPNNPTATSYPLDQIRRICAESGALVLVDGAYQEFASQDLMPLLDEFPNVVLLRTFSKAMAMGGLRVGYAIAHERLTEEIHKGQLPYSLNLLSATAALIALERAELFQEQVAVVRAERARLWTALDALPWAAPVESDANFILVRLLGHPPRALFEHLLARGILVRDVSGYPGLAEYIRISVGAPEENRQLIEALDTFSVEYPPA